MSGTSRADQKLGSAADPAEIERLRQQLKEETNKRDSLRPGTRRTGGAGKTGGTPAKQKCQPGDPLCSDL